MWAIPIAAFLSLLFSSETLHLAAFRVGLVCLLAPCRGGIEKMAGLWAHRPCSQHAGKAWLGHKVGVSDLSGFAYSVWATHSSHSGDLPGQAQTQACCVAKPVLSLLCFLWPTRHSSLEGNAVLHNRSQDLEHCGPDERKRLKSQTALSSMSVGSTRLKLIRALGACGGQQRRDSVGTG